MQTGVVSQNYPLATATVFEPLSREYYLFGPQRGYYEILDSNLDKKAKVPAMELNPNGMDSFIIQDAVLIENSIVISGVEYTTKEFLPSVKSHQSDEFIERSRFARHVLICMEHIGIWLSFREYDCCRKKIHIKTRRLLGCTFHPSVTINFCHPLLGGSFLICGSNCVAVLHDFSYN